MISTGPRWTSLRRTVLSVLVGSAIGMIFAYVFNAAAAPRSVIGLAACGSTRILAQRLAILLWNRSQTNVLRSTCDLDFKHSHSG